MNYKITATSDTSPFYPFENGKWVYLEYADHTDWVEAHTIGMTDAKWHQRRVTLEWRKNNKCQAFYSSLFANVPEWTIHCALGEMKEYNNANDCIVNSNAGYALYHSHHREERYDDSHERYEYRGLDERAMTWQQTEDIPF